MKTLDLNAYGVSEMNSTEMQATEGGNPIVWLIIGILVSEALDRDAAKDFKEGYNDARNK
jgi:hypothetical protein